MAKGFILAAPSSGSGKTSLTFGLLAALRKAGTAVQGFKVGPDYIDPHYHALAAGRPCPNLDPWAMTPERMKSLLTASDADLCVIEGVMGLFDGAQSGGGSTADLARTLGLPVVLVVDAKGMSGSVAALVHGFSRFDPSIDVAGVILNRVGSDRHESMLREALQDGGIPVLGSLPRLPSLSWPSRHLGLTLPQELPDMDAQARQLASVMAKRFDLSALHALARALPAPGEPESAAAFFPSSAGSIALASDDAFRFAYPHWLTGRERRFSPLANQRVPDDADFVFLPGGYPELHAAKLSKADAFWDSLRAAAARGVTIYGECGGYMVLGEALTVNGTRFPMAGLLPVATHYTTGGARTLGYRSLTAPEDFWAGTALKGHEFHASSAECLAPPSLFHAADSRQASLGLHGHQISNILGSYIHIIDREPTAPLP
jgi:cobyrinic acid a,c-diamide synthase